MQYTKYLSAMLKAQGAPMLNNEAFGTIMNIVHLEGARSALLKLKIKEKNHDTFYKYDIWILEYTDKIARITNNLPPKIFFKTLDRSQE